MSDKEVKRGLQSTELATSIADALEGRRSFLRLAAGAGTAIGVGGLLVACGGGGEDGLVRETPKEETAPVPATCPTTVWNLTAGQTILVGTVSVSNDTTNLYVTYTLTKAGCTFGTLHLWVGNDLARVPANRQGIPVPGKFPYKYDASGSTSYTFTIPLSALNVDVNTSVCDATNPPKLFVVAHAEVNCTNDDGTVSSETAFGGPNPGPGPRWWFYGQYTVCCLPGGPLFDRCTTAYAKGGWVFTTDRKSNPERLPSLNLTKNRWGWAINVKETGTTTYQIWAGAGLNNTANGVLVGTLTVDWDGWTTAVVTYQLSGTNCLEEVHVYVGDTPPTTIAPGQYDHIAYYPDGCTNSHTTTASVSDTDGDGIWIVAHSVVCFPA